MNNFLIIYLIICRIYILPEIFSILGATKNRKHKNAALAKETINNERGKMSQNAKVTTTRANATEEILLWTKFKIDSEFQFQKGDRNQNLLTSILMGKDARKLNGKLQIKRYRA